MYCGHKFKEGKAFWFFKSAIILPIWLHLFRVFDPPLPHLWVHSDALAPLPLSSCRCRKLKMPEFQSIPSLQPLASSRSMESTQTLFPSGNIIQVGHQPPSFCLLPCNKILPVCMNGSQEEKNGRTYFNIYRVFFFFTGTPHKCSKCNKVDLG